MNAPDFITAHLSEDQMKEIAIEEWRSMCRDAFEGRAETVISNIAYRLVREMVQEALGDSANQMICDKAIELIKELSAYTVFHAPSVYDREPSQAWKVLQKAVSDNSDLVAERVKHHLHNLSKSDALEIIKTAKMTLDIGEARK